MMRIILVYILLFISLSSDAQKEISFEVQVYPTGFIPGLTYELPIHPKASLSLRVGANIFDHRDLGVQDAEEGSGFGGSLGYKRYIKEDRAGWYWQIRADIWSNQVDWTNDTTDVNLLQGSTSIIVLQPTGALGYSFVFGSFALTPSLSFGYEWNVKTKGEPTGEGSIILLGLQAGYRF